MARNFIACHGEHQRFGITFSRDGDFHHCAFRALQQVGNFRGGELFGGFVVHFDNHVAGANPRIVGRRARVWRQHDGMIFPRSYDHSDAVVFPALVFAEERKLFGVKKAGVRIEHPEHARNCSLVDGLVHVHLVGVVVLDHVQNAGEVAHGALIVVRRSRGSPHIGPVNAPQCSG